MLVIQPELIMSKQKEDRATICEIISEMLDNPDENEIYPTTKSYDRLEEYVKSVRTQAVGWAWAEACTQLDNGNDPREYDQSNLIDRSENELNIEFEVV